MLCNGMYVVMAAQYLRRIIDVITAQKKGLKKTVTKVGTQVTHMGVRIFLFVPEKSEMSFPSSKKVQFDVCI